MNPNSPEFILVAVKRIYDELPDLIGQNDWNNIKATIDEYITAIEKATSSELRLLPSTQLWGELAKYEPARLRLIAEIKIQETVTGNIIEMFATLSTDDSALQTKLLAEIYAGMKWDIESESIPQSDEDVRSVRIKMRGISMEAGGEKGGKSIKFKNLNLDIANMMTVAGGFFLTGQDMLDKPKPFIIAAGVLVMVGTLLNGMVKEISQQEATVFWGFLVAASHKVDKQASTARILEKTNSERAKRGLDSLSVTQIEHSLKVMRQLGSIESINDTTWQLVETVKLVG